MEVDPYARKFFLFPLLTIFRLSSGVDQEDEVRLKDDCVFLFPSPTPCLGKGIGKRREEKKSSSAMTGLLPPSPPLPFLLRRCDDYVIVMRTQGMKSCNVHEVNATVLYPFLLFEMTLILESCRSLCSNRIVVMGKHPPHPHSPPLPPPFPVTREV